MNKPDVLEFWLGQQLMLRLDSSFAPNDGDLVNIKQVTYRVVGRSFSVDHSDDPFMARVRCNVILEKDPTP